MVTGDGLVTAQAIAEQVGADHHVRHQSMLHRKPEAEIFNCDVFAVCAHLDIREIFLIDPY